MGQHPPGASRPQDVEDAVDEVTLRDRAGSPRFARLPLRQQRPNEFPLFVRQVAGIGLRLAHAGILPVGSIANSLSVVFTDWLSMIPTLGNGSRPSATRVFRRRVS